MAEAAVVGSFGGSLGAPGGPPPGPGPLEHLARGVLSTAGRRLRRVGTHPAGPRSWLFLGGAVGVCEAAGLDPSLGLVGAISRGLPHSPLLPGGLRGPLALLLFSSGLWLLLGLTLRLGLRLILGGTGGALGRPGPPPRLWLALVRMFAGRRPGLRSLQGALPALPLPPLSETVRQAVESLQSLDPGGAGQGLPPLARSFLGGPGPRLQRWLRLRGWALPCYLSELWEEQLHLGSRGPLPSTGSYYLMDLLGPPPTRVPAARAANVAFAFLQFRSLVRDGTLPPVLFRGSLPTCSAQYERLFDTTRLPGEHRDRLQHFGGGSHLAVLWGGRLFRVPLSPPPSPPQLQGHFQKVLEQNAEPGEPPESPGVLTGGDRAAWARARALLRAGGGPSAAALGVLEDAAFVIAFDPSPHGDPPKNGDPPPPKRGPPPRGARPPPGRGPGRGGQGAADGTPPQPVVRQVADVGRVPLGARRAQRGALVGRPPRGRAPLGVRAGPGPVPGLRRVRELPRAGPAPGPGAPPGAALGAPPAGFGGAAPGPGAVPGHGRGAPAPRGDG
ncbi:carnitine O-palmitoyltransferase 1, brain isoform-like [Poecile atricapillus]|uniref:carnitine O-palmitoyltransferase 1, brain isoform-like n=1 Tax=Poecile atricapillus TaxID=48891 RepID=UPI002739DF94|nr:carnitine O-palmitoyltransferase 1, brain isoform-like [Poecile atricapillus]